MVATALGSVLEIRGLSLPLFQVNFPLSAKVSDKWITLLHSFFHFFKKQNRCYYFCYCQLNTSLFNFHHIYQVYGLCLHSPFASSLQNREDQSLERVAERTLEEWVLSEDHGLAAENQLFKGPHDLAIAHSTCRIHVFGCLLAGSKWIVYSYVILITMNKMYWKLWRKKSMLQVYK